MITRTVRGAAAGALGALVGLAVLAPPSPAQSYEERLERAGHLKRRTGWGASFDGLEELVFPLGQPQSALVTAYYDKHFSPFTIPESAEFAALDDLFFTTYTVPKDGAPDPGQPGSWTIENLAAKEVGRFCYSTRELNDVMTYFWHRHFSNFNPKLIGYFTNLGHTYEEAAHLAGYFGWQENVAFRQNALGKFKDLLYASAQGVPMLVYLDTVNNVAPTQNENYARELLELHCLGLDPATGQSTLYSWTDIVEVAKSFTGWTVVDNGTGGQLQYEFDFDENAHIGGARSILPNVTGGPHPIDEDNVTEGQGEDILDLLAGLPETCDFVCGKLYNFFVEEGPLPTQLRDDCRAVWGNEGDIGACLRILLDSPEMLNVTGMQPNHVFERVSMPLESMTQTVRAYEGSSLAWTLQPPPIGGVQSIVRVELFRLLLEQYGGQELFRFGPPDGFPIESIEQVSTQLMLGRVRFNQELYNALDLTTAAYLNTTFYDALGLCSTYNVSPADPFRITDMAFLFVTQNEATANDLLLPLEMFTRTASGQPATETLANLVEQFPDLQARQEWYDRVNQVFALIASYSQSIMK